MLKRREKSLYDALSISITMKKEKVSSALDESVKHFNQALS